MKKILIMGANPETASLVMKAKAMGLMTYVADYDPTSYAKKFADVPVNIDASHVEDLIDYVKKEGIDGVLAGVSEALLPYYYEICKKLNYPCFATLEQFEVMISKDKFKNMCRKYQVPVVDEYDTDKTSEVRLPVVVKPVDSCSSKGISVCKNKEELDAGIENALKYSKSGKFIIEKYMTGDEVVIYYVIQNGKAFLVGMCDRYTNKEQKGVAQLPTAYIYPSRYLDSYKKNTDEKVCNMLTKMGIKNGILFLQAFVEDGNVKIYEPGFRLNGAQEHILLSELTGVDAKELLLNFAMTGKMSSYSLISVPIPLSVNSSTRMEWGMVPQTILTCLIPFLTAVTQPRTLGIMPPEMVPFSIMRSTSATRTSGSRVDGSEGSLRMPSISVRYISL